MVANDKINFKTGSRAPIAQLLAGYIVAETFVKPLIGKLKGIRLN